FVPYPIVLGQVVGIDQFSAGPLIDAPKGMGDVQVTVVVGELLPGMDVPHGDLKIVGGREAIGIEAVVHITAVVPAKDVISLVVPIAVGVQNVLVGHGQGL